MRLATAFQQVAECSSMCRRGDSVVRTGGDEFVMVLRDARLATLGSSSSGSAS